jgi:hypothetical protein
MYISFFLNFYQPLLYFTWDEIKVIIMCITFLAYICFFVHWFNQSNDVFSVPLLLGAATFRGEDSDNDVKCSVLDVLFRSQPASAVSRWVYQSLYIHHYFGRQSTRTSRTHCLGYRPDNFSLVNCNDLCKYLEYLMVSTGIWTSSYCSSCVLTTEAYTNQYCFCLSITNLLIQVVISFAI